MEGQCRADDEAWVGREVATGPPAGMKVVAEHQADEPG